MKVQKSHRAMCLLILMFGVLFWLLLPSDPKWQLIEAKFKSYGGVDDHTTIEELRAVGKEAVEFLVKRINQKDSTIKEHYIKLWPDLPRAWRRIFKLPMADSEIRFRAVGILWEMGPEYSGSNVALEALIRALRHPDVRVRGRAEGAIGGYGPSAKAAVPELIEGIKRRMNLPPSDWDTNGIAALGRIGPDAEAAVPVLRSVMETRPAMERVVAAESIIKIGGNLTGVVETLELFLEDSDTLVARRAAAVLTLLQATNEL